MVDGESINRAELLAREREERILFILEVKKSRNALHCVSLVVM